MFLQPALNGFFFFFFFFFFFLVGKRVILPCQDEYLKTRRKFTFGTSRYRMATWSYKCSSSWHAHTTIVLHWRFKSDLCLVMTHVLGLEAKESDSRKKRVPCVTMLLLCVVTGVLMSLSSTCHIDSISGKPFVIHDLWTTINAWLLEVDNVNNATVTSTSLGALIFKGGSSIFTD